MAAMQVKQPANPSYHKELCIDSKRLKEDILPVPTKERTENGIVELFLDEGSSIKLIGMIYGLQHNIQGPGFEATLFLDHYNQRVKILSYTASDIDALIIKVRQIAELNSFDKIFCVAPASDWTVFLKHGYVLEALIKYYLHGQDGFVMSKFRSQARIVSNELMDEILQIEDIMSQPVSDPFKKRTCPEGYTVRLARHEDIPAMIKLYKKIFASYPSPLVYPDYMNQIFQKDTLFIVCLDDAGQIVAAASADLLPQHQAAEVTDCATDPAQRGRGLMSVIIQHLENELQARDYICAYTMARARSFGMNNVFYQLGYEFMGRLNNNCDIFGAFEDMNIWVRDLRVGCRQTSS